MSLEVLTKHHLEFLSLEGGCTGSPESTPVKMPHCWKSHVTHHMLLFWMHLLSSFRKGTMQKNNTVCMYCISSCSFVAVVIYTLLYASLTSPRSPAVPSYRSATEVTRGLSNLFNKYMSYDSNVTSLGTSSVDINIAGADKNIRIYDTNRTCNISSTRQVHASPFQCSHLMTLDLGIPGRTGNQMFEYAALLGVAHRHNYTAVISPKFSLTSVFNLPNVADINTTGMIRLKEHKCCTYDKKFEKIDFKHNYILYGNFETWRYFNEINNTIRRIYKIRDVYLKPAVDFLKRVSRRGNPNVCVHVRRGDFIWPTNVKHGFGFAGLGYINKAMSYFNTKLNDPLFIVMSDDKRWCKLNLNRTNTVISPFNKVYEDLALMTLCDHVIVTSGSFGWWGAWLSNGTVVYYKDFPRPNSLIDKNFNRHDYYPASWIGLA